MMYDINTIKETNVYKRHAAHMPEDFAEQLLLASACKECEFEDYLGNINDTLGELDMTFYWNNSPQGHDYWATLNERIPHVS